jgi:O-antigen/teichoic acid export membrane protein
LANIPFNVIQGSGNPKVAAIIHAVELPLYLLLIHFLIQKYGVSGAAVAWTIRVLVDAVLMNIFAAKFIDETIFSVMKRLVAQSVWTVVLCLPLFLANKMISWMTGILGLIAYLVYAGYVWNQKDKSA